MHGSDNRTEKQVGKELRCNSHEALFSGCTVGFNPLTTIVISKLLEMIGRSAYVLACSISIALHSDINQTGLCVAPY